MNKDIKKRWLDALRSGEYKQGTGQLRMCYPNGDITYCCLGVLCDLYAKEHNLEWDKTSQDKWIYNSFGSLPDYVMDWAGLTDVDPKVNLCDLSLPNLSILNDHLTSFKDIADLIEVQL